MAVARRQRRAARCARSNWKSGHALRRYLSENREQTFCRQRATGASLRPRRELNVRVDTGIEQATKSRLYYDPMIAKLVVWDVDPRRGLERMWQALPTIASSASVPTSLSCHRLVVCPAFADADLDTGLIERSPRVPVPGAQRTTRNVFFVAAVAGLLREQAAALNRASHSGDPWSPWSSHDGGCLTDSRNDANYRSGDSCTSGRCLRGGRLCAWRWWRVGEAARTGFSKRSFAASAVGWADRRWWQRRRVMRRGTRNGVFPMAPLTHVLFGRHQGSLPRPDDSPMPRVFLQSGGPTSQVGTLVTPCLPDWFGRHSLPWWLLCLLIPVVFVSRLRARGTASFRWSSGLHLDLSVLLDRTVSQTRAPS
ncbi:hypothetical protein [Candidatus Accumulibacter sp. ACC012]|uniref:hypothetical protein n=1 Tax=Candidatus Accumulibacter sp. ACC012 TaxID=2823332 RepID=UPI0034260739